MLKGVDEFVKKYPQNRLDPLPAPSRTAARRSDSTCAVALPPVTRYVYVRLYWAVPAVVGYLVGELVRSHVHDHSHLPYPTP